jgi:signal transduction histidine kinase
MVSAIRKAKVLVVEDDIHLLEGIRDILELDGYAVLTAENGNHGLEVLHNQSTPPDLIVSDIMMPKMDGIQFLKEVRKETRWLDIPFIFLTAKGEKADYQRGMRLGVDDYVVKPYDPGDLLVKIQSRLERLRDLRRAHSEVMANLKRQILTILNHEFRTPLTFVVAYADMLNEPGTQLSQQEIMAYLKGVSGGAERLRNLIENFILLVEIETGDIKSTFNWRKRKVENLNELFTTARDRIKPLEEQKPRDVQIQIADGIPAFEADPEYLTIAIGHLLQNAIKFSDPDKPVVTGAHVNDNYLHLWAKDEGRGIPKTELENIWQSFYQIDRARNEDQGAGAGLTIVRGIAELHGGTVNVTSEPDKGSTFEIIIPLEKPAQ